MRQAIALTVVVALGLLVSTAPAGAASTKKGPTLKSLQAQITSLQKQVKTLKTRVTETEDVALFGVVYGVCSTAVVADTFEDTLGRTGLVFRSTFAARVLRCAAPAERLSGVPGDQDRACDPLEATEHRGPACAARSVQVVGRCAAAPSRPHGSVRACSALCPPALTLDTATEDQRPVGSEVLVVGRAGAQRPALLPVDRARQVSSVSSSSKARSAL